MQSDCLKIISIRDNPEYTDDAIAYFQKHWATEDTMMVYEDCLKNTIGAKNPLPQWYLLIKIHTIIGCAGLITNDFISRMDLYPWICALFIEKEHRGNHYGHLLIEKAKEDTRNGGFEYVYLSTDFVGYYENYGFEFVGYGYHPWGEISRIYRSEKLRISGKPNNGTSVLK